MKKFLFLIISMLVLSSCTEQSMARQFGGKMEVEVKPGYKVTSATWKENDLFYFMEPMEEGYMPKEKMFVEKSSFGALETEVVFKESK